MITKNKGFALVALLIVGILFTAPAQAQTLLWKGYVKVYHKVGGATAPQNMPVAGDPNDEWDEGGQITLAPGAHVWIAARNTLNRNAVKYVDLEIRRAAQRLTVRVSPDHTLPHPEDPIADARLIIDALDHDRTSNPSHST